MTQGFVNEFEIDEIEIEDIRVYSGSEGVGCFLGRECSNCRSHGMKASIGWKRGFQSL